MKSQIKPLIDSTIQSLVAKNILSADIKPNYKIDQTKDKSHGDLACNIALTLAKAAKLPPRKIAELILEHFPESSIVSKIDIAGPGFINFFLSEDSQSSIIRAIHDLKVDFGRSDIGKGQKIHMEYVSANPTGPLHVGHGRGAAYGATLANLLTFTGHEVHKEYYVNDAGRQMHILATSVWLRYLEHSGESIKFPSNGYKGEYVIEIAKQLKDTFGEQFVHTFHAACADVPADDDGQGNGDKEAHIDGLIQNCRHLLANDYQHVFQLALNTMVTDIKADLEAFGVSYDNWFSEQSLNDSGAIDLAIETLKKNHYLYEKEGAWWFRSSDFGDDKDRVVIRENGEKTYFASDIAYHMNKLNRGYDQIIDILGADHHGYVARVKAAMQALGAKPEQLEAPLIQFVSLYRGEEKVAMSTRSGSFVTLKALREEISNDAARFFYVMRKADQAMDFDLKLATSKSDENPLYYIQYAHARIASATRQLVAKGYTLDIDNGLIQLDLLNSETAKALRKKFWAYQEVINNAANEREPHLLIHYLRELASLFHSYYNIEKCIVEDKNTRDARFALITAVKQLLQNGLQLLGVSAPDTM